MANASVAYSLKDFGSYTVGGRQVVIQDRPTQDVWFTPSVRFTYDPNGVYAIEHAYVQYYVPAARNTSPPVLLLHGGGMTGTTWETTPDGRPGWLHLLLQQGFEVHVVDSVERGRAGWCAVEGVWSGTALQRTLQEAWRLFRIGRHQDFSSRIPFTGQRFPATAFDTFSRSFVPRWTTTTAPASAAISALIRRVGEAIVVCHSQGAQIAFGIERSEIDSIRAIVAVEPSGFPAHSDDWSQTPILLMYGDFHGAAKSDPNLLDMGNAWLRTSPAKTRHVTKLWLPDAGVVGNSHMMMMDTNSDDVLKHAIAWLDTLHV
ncbi:MAG: alpha/beta fold hydrolase [Hyphomicrobiaceae bacterium]